MREIKIHGIYKHFKGDFYLIEEIAKEYINIEKLSDEEKTLQVKIDEINKIIFLSYRKI